MYLWPPILCDVAPHHCTVGAQHFETSILSQNTGHQSLSDVAPYHCMIGARHFETSILSQNTGHKSLSDAAPHPR